MNVRIAFKLKDTPPGKTRVTSATTLFKARRFYYTELANKDVVMARIEKFDGWRYYPVEWLKKPEDL